MTDIFLDLDAIKARCDAATPGPWTVMLIEKTLPKKPLGYLQQDGQSLLYLGGFLANDADFIARAREDVPALVQEVARLRAALEAVEWAEYENRCPWCEAWQNMPHQPDCPRQLALGK